MSAQPEQTFQQDPTTPNNGFLGGLLSRQSLGRMVGAALVLPGASAFAPAAAHAGSPLTPADYRVQVGPDFDKNDEVPVTVFNTGVDCETFSFEVNGDFNTQTVNVQSGTQDSLKFPAIDEGALTTFNIADNTDPDCTPGPTTNPTTDPTTAIAPFSFSMSFGISLPNRVGEGGDTTLAIAEGNTSGSTPSSSTTTTETSTTTTTTTVETEGGSGHKRSHVKHHKKKAENCRVPGVTKGGESWELAVSQAIANHCVIGGIKYGSEKGQTAVVTGFDAQSSNPKHPKKIVLRRVAAGKVLAPKARLFPLVHFAK